METPGPATASKPASPPEPLEALTWACSNLFRGRARRGNPIQRQGYTAQIMAARESYLAGIPIWPS